MIIMTMTVVMRRLSAGQDRLDLGDGNHGDELRKEQEERQENAKCSDEDRDLNPRGRVIAP